MATRLSKVNPVADAAGKIPPHNLEAEESVLGSCLISREAIANVLEVLSSDDFYKPAHSEIFASILDLYGRGEPVDAVTLAEELRRRGILESFGGKPYLHTLVSSVPTPGSAVYYARIVEENAILRRLIEASQSIAEIAFGVPEDVESAVDQAENLIYQVAQRRVSDDFRALRDLLTENMELVEKLYERGSSITGLPTGFSELDNITAGLQPSNLIIVAARPSIGKSSLAINIAEHVAIAEREPVVVFSLEMSKMELVQRLMCSEARVDSNRLRRGALQDSDWPKLSHALGRLAEAPMFIDDTPNMTIMEMRAKCRRLKSKHGLGLIIVDYLQLMAPLRRTDNRVQEVSEISRSLKILARELAIPVIAVSQLSRNVEYRADKRPILADLRDCVTGETLVGLADGRRVPIRDLVGTTPEVSSIDEEGRICTASADKVWCVGRRPVFKVRLATGREIRSTGRHRLLGASGWVRVEDLSPGDRVALVRRLPEPRAPEVWPDDRIALLGQLIGDGSYVVHQPIRYGSASLDNAEMVAYACRREFGSIVTEMSTRSDWYHLRISGNGNRWHPAGVNAWLRELGIFGQAHDKRIPEAAFRLGNRQIALLLRHLWATDGTVWVDPAKKRTRVSYTTNSRYLADGVAALLLRLGIVARIGIVPQGRFKPCFQIVVSGAENQRRFLEKVGAFGPRTPQAIRLSGLLSTLVSNTNVDTLPKEVFQYIRQEMARRGISTREMSELRGVTSNGSAAYRFAPSRSLVARYAEILEDDVLMTRATDDLFWDSVVAIEADGEEEVFDLTVPATSAWLADGVVSHNSGALEMDADLVIFIYRDEVYHPDSSQKGIAEIHVAKHRNGPIGKIELAFLEHYTKFATLARGM